MELFTRKCVVSNQSQITLGALIKCIRDAGLNSDSDKKKTITFDFAYSVPGLLHSWRGDYKELSIHPSFDTEIEVYAEDFLKVLESAVGEYFTGYKGGEFYMSNDTPLWVSKTDMSGNTAVIGVYDEGYNIVILTGYCEY